MATTYRIPMADGWRLAVQTRERGKGSAFGGCVAVLRHGGSKVKSFTGPSEGAVTTAATTWLEQNHPQALGQQPATGSSHPGGDHQKQHHQAGPSSWDAWDPGDGDWWGATQQGEPQDAARAAYAAAYRLLGLSGVVTEQQLTRAFHQKARECHPDAGGDAAVFHRVKIAYDLLKCHLVQPVGKQLASEYLSD